MSHDPILVSPRELRARGGTVRDGFRNFVQHAIHVYLAHNSRSLGVESFTLSGKFWPTLFGGEGRRVGNSVCEKAFADSSPSENRHSHRDLQFLMSLRTSSLCAIDR